ncbi:hypothetical protein BDQ12DRAFT_697078 [Crucibulum laeve]|uniref:Glycosyltransferase family 31 protein n=1 Tax=Crucibulum laeve TaxID=68775 RepID=A0A5C3M933_9AGAR|nr:hypothetical protein BDQ12DRAFT_697078 [Crucibulum laeve]
MASSTRSDGYDSASSTDSEDTTRTQSRSRAPFASTSATGSSNTTHSVFLFPPLQSGRSSVSSTATSTPLPSRSTSPLPQFYASGPSSSCPSDTDSEPNTPLMRVNANRNPWWRENRRTWWSMSRRRRRRDGKILRTLKKWFRRALRHPFFPGQPITIVLTLILLSVFAIFLTLLLIYILNPDKEPLPWRAYCSAPQMSGPLETSPSSSYPYLNMTMGVAAPPFPPANLDSLPPAGVFVGIFSIDSAFDRRMLVRTSWASHPRSRDGAGDGDNGAGTSRSIVRFILGQPQKDWERRIKLEMEMYNDIIILPITENMNKGKTHTFFQWASINAWVPPVYVNTTVPPPQFSYTNHTASPPSLAPHDPYLAWEDIHSGKPRQWVRPDYVVKVDDDSFVMLAELESRLRVELHTKPPIRQGAITSLKARDEASFQSQSESTSTLSIPAVETPPPDSRAIPYPENNDPLVYWGYLVTNRLHQFMAGELYALSWSLVDWVAKEPALKALTKGAEDKQTAKWMRLHPRASEVRWVSERCWIYDHPRSGTVYAHGFLFPSEVSRIKRSIKSLFDRDFQAVLGNVPPTSAALAHSSVSTFGVRYAPPVPELTPKQSVEALIEGSEMSLLREGSPMTPEYAWTHREGRKRHYEGNRVGGTVVVHFIKKHMWFLETALALLEGEELSEFEKYERSRSTEDALLVPMQTRAMQRAIAKHRRA